MNNETILLDSLSMDLTIDEILSHAMPPLAPIEDMRLTNKLIKEGCKESIKVAIIDGKYVIVDGHNRYRICKKYKIPFKVEVLPLKSIEEARAWLIENQLGRRNVSDFVKCEYALQMRDSLIKEGRRRQGQRFCDSRVFPNLEKQEEPYNSHKVLAGLLGISNGTLGCALWLINNAAERTKQDLRIGAISIHMAYKGTKDLLRGDDEDTRRKVFSGELTIQKMVEDRKEEAKKQQQTECEACAGSIEDEEGDADDDDDVEELYGELSDVDQVQEDEGTSQSTEQCHLFDRLAHPVFPGYGLVSEPDPTPEDVRLPAPAPGYEEALIRTYGGAPEGDLEYRGAAEFQYIRSETKRILGYFTDRMTGIITDISDAAATEDNLNELMSMLDEGFTTLQNKIMEVMRNGQEESE